MVAHAESKFPNECCGAMIGTIDGDREARHRRPCRWKTPTPASRARATNCVPKICSQPTASARAAGLDLIGIFHSHPDCDAYFSKTDLENSCPWYSFVVLSVKSGKFDHAASFLPNADQTAAEKEELIWPKS